MKRLTFSLLLLATGALLLTSCAKDETKSYEASQMVGKWQKSGSNEYWRYESDGTGNFWDEDEDVHEGEGTHFRWSLNEDELHLTFVGTMGQEVPRDYNILELTSSVMRLEDSYYGSETTYYKQ